MSKQLGSGDATRRVQQSSHFCHRPPPGTLATPAVHPIRHVYRRDCSLVRYSSCSSTRLANIARSSATAANGSQPAPISSPANKGKGKQVHDDVMDDDEEDDEEEEEEDEDEDMAEVRIALIFFLDASSWPASHASAYVGLGTDFYARLTRLARTG